MVHLCSPLLGLPEVISLPLVGHRISDVSMLLLNIVLSSVGFVHVTFFDIAQEHTCLLCSAV